MNKQTEIEEDDSDLYCAKEMVNFKFKSDKQLLEECDAVLIMSQIIEKENGFFFKIAAQ